MTTELEIFRATVEHRRPGRIMYRAGFTPDLDLRVKQHVGEGKDVAEHYGFHKCAWFGMRPPADLPKLDYSKYWEGVELPPGTTFAGGLALVPGSMYHFSHYISPLRNATRLTDIEGYPMHDMTEWDTSWIEQEVQKAHAQGIPAQGWVGHMYESAWQVRGYEQFLMDIIERPAWADCLLERIARQNMIAAVSFARAGVDWISCGDDVANQNSLMFSPATWRKMFHAKWMRIWAEIKEINPACQIWYHSDGNISQVIDDLVDAGLDILNPVQPECMDTDALHKRFGKRLTFDGCIGTQSTMPWGTPDDVRARVKYVIEKYGRNGGLIVSPTHVLEPEVPIANIEAMVQACKEFGTFE